MTLPSIDLLSRACQIYMHIAYPGGPDTVPTKRRPYCAVAEDVCNFLPPSPIADGVCQAIPAAGGGIRGYAFRMGSTHYPNLKLKLQLIDFDNQSVWVAMVDTHDAFARGQHRPPADHPDAAEWTRMQDLNRRVKEQIEMAWESAGLTTFASLLRRDLEKRRS